MIGIRLAVSALLVGTVLTPLQAGGAPAAATQAPFGASASGPMWTAKHHRTTRISGWKPGKIVASGASPLRLTVSGPTGRRVKVKKKRRTATGGS